MHDPRVAHMATRHHILGLVMCIVTTLVMCINLATLFIISALNMLRWTFILFKKKSNVVMFECFMFHLHIRLPIFLQRVSLKSSVMIFAPVSAFANLPIRLRRCARIRIFCIICKSSYLSSYLGDYIVNI